MAGLCQTSRWWATIGRSCTDAAINLPPHLAAKNDGARVTWRDLVERPSHGESNTAPRWSVTSRLHISALFHF